MASLFGALGIETHLLIAQAVNFLALLIVLRIFAYKPVITMLKDRRTKIEDGITKIKEANTKLREANDMAVARMKEAEAEGVMLIKAAEESAKAKELQMLAEAKKKESAMMEDADARMKARESEMQAHMKEEARALVKEAIAKTVAMDPTAIDEALIKKAVEATSR
jgi:F-type H+-transporting ATPase subunit b